MTATDPLSCYCDPYSCQDSVSDIIPVVVWTDSKDMFPADPKRIELEKEQTLQQVSKQMKQGLIKKKPPMKIETVLFKDNQNIKDVIQRVTYPLITKIKGYELFGPCFCGCKEQLKDCAECLLMIKNKK